MFKPFPVVITLLISLSLIAAQCGSVITVPPAESQAIPAAQGGPAIKVTEAVARASIPNGAVYMHLTNEGDADDRLIGVETDVAEAAELHETRIDENEVMRMSPVETIAIPASGSATLEPGGLHIMLIGLKEDLATGDGFELTLTFEQSGPQRIEVEVIESMAHGGMMDQADMGHEQAEGEMEEMEEMGHHPEAEGETAHVAEAGETAEHSHGAESHAASSATAMQPQVFRAVVAAYLMDTAGFHGMDERLNEEGLIDAGDAGLVNRVKRVLAATDWPEALQPQAEEFQTVLTEYAEALANDDVEAAKPLAAQAHELQHDLSQSVEHWAGEMGDNGDGEGHQDGETESHGHEEGEGD